MDIFSTVGKEILEEIIEANVAFLLISKGMMQLEWILG